MTDEAAEAGFAPLVVEVFGWTSDVKLRVQPDEGAEVRRLLDDAGVPHSTGAEFAEGPVVDLVVAVIESREAWAALGAAITGYLTRNRGRSVKVGDIVVTGENSKDSMRIIRELQDRRDAQSNQDPVDDGEEPPQT